jgi:hypothetical protein
MMMSLFLADVGNPVMNPWRWSPVSIPRLVEVVIILLGTGVLL